VVYVRLGRREGRGGGHTYAGMEGSYKQTGEVQRLQQRLQQRLRRRRRRRRRGVLMRLSGVARVWQMRRGVRRVLPVLRRRQTVLTVLLGWCSCVVGGRTERAERV
jgi:hypothetical protein